MYKILWTIPGILLVAGAIFLHRIYKHIGRRCDCGNANSYFHISRISFPLGAGFDSKDLPRRIKMLLEDRSWENLKDFWKNFRWWIRNAHLVTFQICPACDNNDGHRMVRVVTVSNRPVSLWHLYWVHWFHPEQLYGEPDGKDSFGLNQVLWEYHYELYKKGRPKPDKSGDKPPPIDLFYGEGV